MLTRTAHRLAVEAITVTYNNGHTALTDASFQLTGGTICALVGVNGSGKSTLFKNIMGMVKPVTGRVALDDQPIRTALKQNLVAYVPQSEDVDWNFPVLVRDVVMMGRYGKMSFLRIPSANDKCKVEEALARVGLNELAERQIGELSGGQKKRVFLARALAQEGRVLLLDDLQNMQDENDWNALCELIHSGADRRFVLLSPWRAAGPSDRLPVQRNGKILPCAARSNTIKPPVR